MFWYNFYHQACISDNSLNYKTRKLMEMFYMFGVKTYNVDCIFHEDL